MTIRTVLIIGLLLLSGGLFGQIVDPLNKRGKAAEKEFVTGIRNDQGITAQIQIDKIKKEKQVKLKEEPSKLLVLFGGLLILALVMLSVRLHRLRAGADHEIKLQRVQIKQKTESLYRLATQLDALLGEKEWLMKEIHHRVKNNLQIVISLLSTQSNYIDNDIAYNAIRESQHRMQAISLIYQKLYQSENLARVDIRSYIAELVTYLRESFDTDLRIRFELDIVPLDFEVTRAVPLGLILNEAITNAIKYAFPDQRTGKISICLKEDDDKTFLLRIHDDGVGSPVISDIQSRKSLGMSLMHGLSKQLSGNLSVKNEEGMTITVNFSQDDLLKTV
jgi:two-component sensor histidine kinase